MAWASSAPDYLVSIGIPKNSVVEYETAIKTDRFLVLVHGMAAEVDRAKLILARTVPVCLTMHSNELALASTE